MITSSAWRATAVLCCGLALATRPAAAQSAHRLEFRVIDSVTGAPVPLANVDVTSPARVAAASTRLTTDSVGQFVVGAAEGEQLLISVRRLGFVPAAIRITPTPRDSIFVIALAPSAAVLSPTITRARGATRRLAVMGFDERRRVGLGTFLDSARIADKKPYDLLSLLRPYLHGCTMIFVDGMRLLGLRDVKVQDVLAIEIYDSNLQAPPQFANPIDSRCGSIVVWRRL